MAGNEASTKQAIAFGEGLGPGFTLYSMQKWKRSVQIMTQCAIDMPLIMRSSLIADLVCMIDIDVAKKI